ncbi:MAG: hypothetical protein WAW85_07945 [Gordonia sp. (in: high G+C Gram-positive bacteria)]|uniref:hypothetical protein n=1 Tax=Gordonia sp. (in: high G+C Gram-positive bacteria) TaxID=84139 RepID=UPI003BB7103C
MTESVATLAVGEDAVTALKLIRCHLKSLSATLSIANGLSADAGGGRDPGKRDSGITSASDGRVPVTSGEVDPVSSFRDVGEQVIVWSGWCRHTATVAL